MHEFVTGLLAAVATIWVCGVIVVAMTDQFTTLLAYRRHPIRRRLPH